MGESAGVGVGIIKGKRAVVTGASSGLGVDFARELAARGCHLVLVARREDQLREVQREIAGRHGVEVEFLAMDLAVKDAPQALHDRLKTAGKAVDVVVNNAGFGLFGPFLEIPWERERNMLELDIVTLVQMVRVFAPDMVARRFGFFLHVASIGAFQPTPLYASYSAAKSFVLYWGEAIARELRGSGVSSTVISPGITATEFLKVSGQQATAYQQRMMMTSPEVARIGIAAMLKGRPSVVPGLLNALTAWGTRFMPRQWNAAVAHRLMK